MKRSVLESLGLYFDETITFGGAESGLCHQLATMGRSLLFFDDLVIGHAPQMNGRQFCRKAFLQGAGAQCFSEKQRPLTTKFLNEFSPELNYADPKRRFIHELYKLCFRFGYSKKDRSAEFTGASLVWFVIRNFSILKKNRELQRKIYVAFRSAWLNSSTEPQS